MIGSLLIEMAMCRSSPLGEMDRDIVLRHGLYGDAVRPLHHQPIDAHILDIVVVPIVRVARDDASLVNVVPAIASVQTKQWQQVEQIDVLVDRHFLPRRGRDALEFPGKQLEAPDELEELLFQ